VERRVLDAQRWACLAVRKLDGSTLVFPRLDETSVYAVRMQLRDSYGLVLAGREQ